MSIPLHMVQGGFLLGRVAGIPLYANSSSLFLALMLVLNGFSFLGFSLSTMFLVPLLVVLFLASLLAHELGHALTAQAFGIPTRMITLHALGGVAQISSEPRTPKQEFLVALAGPLVSLALSLAFWIMAEVNLSLQLSVTAYAGLYYLALSNLVLAIFNLLPGLPLDGGRILRAAIWRLRNSRVKGTLAAASGGQIIGGVFYFFAFLNLLSFNLGGALMAGFMGWFLRSAAMAERRRALQEETPWHQATSFLEFLRMMQQQNRGKRGFSRPTPPASGGMDDEWEIIRYPDGREVYVRRH